MSAQRPITQFAITVTVPTCHNLIHATERKIAPLQIESVFVALKKTPLGAAQLPENAKMPTGADQWAIYSSAMFTLPLLRIL